MNTDRETLARINAAIASGEATDTHAPRSSPAAKGVYTFTVPGWIPPILNQFLGRSWTVKHRLRKDTEAMLVCYGYRVPRATGQRSVALLVTLGPRRKQFDADAADKLLLDSCVNVGLLLDDSARWLVGRVAVTFARGPESSTTITLTDIVED